MRVTLIALGCGTEATLTAEARAALTRADFLTGAARLLEQLPAEVTTRREPAIQPQAILERLLNAGCREGCVLYSGDTGFYSGARTLLPLLNTQGIKVQILPGISSIQYLAAKLGRPWQNWVLRSAHGVDCDAVEAVCQGAPACFLTGGALDPAALCRQLADAGLGDLPAAVGENLSYPSERIRRGTAAVFAGESFAPLSILLVEAAPVLPQRTPGIPDGEFLRGAAPMTKQEIRAAALGKLGAGPADVCWDIGAGTGSVSVELALQARAVWAVERNETALPLLRANKERFCAWKLRIVEGDAPEALSALPAPDAVFIGGSGGKLPRILDAVHCSNPHARVCVSAVTLETLHTALSHMTDLGYETEAVQISVSRTRPAGNLHLLTAQNPVFLITGVRP